MRRRKRGIVFNKIIVPVDLTHLGKLERALDVSAELSKLYSAELCYVGVTSHSPDSIAHNAKEYEHKLEEFTKAQVAKSGHAATCRAYPSNDPAVDLTDTLLKAEADLKADLVVVASHVPNFADHFWPSHGGELARKSSISVFVVR